MSRDFPLKSSAALLTRRAPHRRHADEQVREGLFPGVLGKHGRDCIDPGACFPACDSLVRPAHPRELPRSPRSSQLPNPRPPKLTYVRNISPFCGTGSPEAVPSLDLHEIAKAYSVDWAPEGYVDPSEISVRFLLRVPPSSCICRLIPFKTRLRRSQLRSRFPPRTPSPSPPPRRGPTPRLSLLSPKHHPSTLLRQQGLSLFIRTSRARGWRHPLLLRRPPLL